MPVNIKAETIYALGYFSAIPKIKDIEPAIPGAEIVLIISSPALQEQLAVWKARTTEPALFPVPRSKYRLQRSHLAVIAPARQKPLNPDSFYQILTFPLLRF